MKPFFLPFIMLHLVVWPALAASPLLSFTSKTVSLTLKPYETSARIVFAFENKSNEAIVVERHATSCSCIEAKFKDNKMAYAPGEKGEITAIFQVANIQGIVRKNVVVWQKGDKAGNPSVTLTAEIEIPELVSITPKSLNWKSGEENDPKAFRIIVQEGESTHVTGVVTTNNDFVPQLKTITKGKEYEVTITPKDSAGPIFGIIKITTDSKTPRYRRLQGFAVIR